MISRRRARKMLENAFEYVYRHSRDFSFDRTPESFSAITDALTLLDRKALLLEPWGFRRFFLGPNHL
jgi:hypothetical protein